MIAADEEAAAVTARPLGADEVRTAYDRLGRKAASTAPRGIIWGHNHNLGTQY